MRCAALRDLAAFWEADIVAPFSFTSDVGGNRDCEKESERVRAAGSMSGMLDSWWSSGTRLLSYGRRRRIRVPGA